MCRLPPAQAVVLLRAWIGNLCSRAASFLLASAVLFYAIPVFSLLSSRWARSRRSQGKSWDSAPTGSERCVPRQLFWVRLSGHRHATYQPCLLPAHPCLALVIPRLSDAPELSVFPSAPSRSSRLPASGFRRVACRQTPEGKAVYLCELRARDDLNPGLQG